MLSEIFDPKNTLQIIGYKEKFNFFKKLLNEDNLPKVTLLSGHKGIGKFTLVCHLMNYYFDKNNYDEEKNLIKKDSIFYNKFIQNLHPNIIHLKGSNLKNLKIENIRKLRDDLKMTTINNKKRFIILDDIELFNSNSINALLKVIEEPSEKNYFFLINNQSKKLLETIKSRCLEIKIILNEKINKEITASLINIFKINLIIEKDVIRLSPGNFLKFNYILDNKNIKIDEDFFINLKNLLNIYKKEKDVFYQDLILFFSEYYFKKNRKKLIERNKVISERSVLIKKINEFFLYNLSQNTLISSLKKNMNE